MRFNGVKVLGTDVVELLDVELELVELPQAANNTPKVKLVAKILFFRRFLRMLCANVEAEHVFLKPPTLPNNLLLFFCGLALV